MICSSHCTHTHTNIRICKLLCNYIKASICINGPALFRALRIYSEKNQFVKHLARNVCAFRIETKKKLCVRNVCTSWEEKRMRDYWADCRLSHLMTRMRDIVGFNANTHTFDVNAHSMQFAIALLNALGALSLTLSLCVSIQYICVVPMEHTNNNLLLCLWTNYYICT